MKKILIIVGVILLIGIIFFFFWGKGRETISNFFNEDADFGSFFDVNPQSRNDFIPDQTTATSTPSQPGEYVAPILRQISFEPVSGFTDYATTSTSTRVSTNPEQGDVIEEFLATSTAIRFQERGTGHIYDVFEFLAAPQRVSNITVQKVYRTLFSSNPDTFLYQSPFLSNEGIQTASATIIHSQEGETATSTPTEQSLTQAQFSNALSELVQVGETNQFAFGLKQGTQTNIYVSTPQRTNERLVATIPFTELTLETTNATSTLVQTKAAANIPGYAYILNLTTGGLNKIIGNINGLLVKPALNSRYVLYSQSDVSRPIIRSYDRTSGTIQRIGFDTIPEKCVPSKVVAEELYCFGSPSYKPGVYPDDWYKGKIFNSENLYRVNLATGLSQTEYVLEGEDMNFDVINPRITDNDDHIIFQNKYDLTLWTIDLDTLRNQF